MKLVYGYFVYINPDWNLIVAPPCECCHKFSPSEATTNSYIMTRVKSRVTKMRLESRLESSHESRVNTSALQPRGPPRSRGLRGPRYATENIVTVPGTNSWIMIIIIRKEALLYVEVHRLEAHRLHRGPSTRWTKDTTSQDSSFMLNMVVFKLGKFSPQTIYNSGGD